MNSTTTLAKMKTFKDFFAESKNDLESEAFDFFRNNFSSYKDLEKNGMKSFKSEIGHPKSNYKFVKGDEKKSAVSDAFRKALQDMALESDL